MLHQEKNKSVEEKHQHFKKTVTVCSFSTDWGFTAVKGCDTQKEDQKSRWSAQQRDYNWPDVNSSFGVKCKTSDVAVKRSERGPSHSQVTGVSLNKWYSANSDSSWEEQSPSWYNQWVQCKQVSAIFTDIRAVYFLYSNYSRTCCMKMKMTLNVNPRFKHPSTHLLC